MFTNLFRFLKNMGSNITLFFRQKLVSLVHSVFIYLLPLFSFISTYIFRLQTDGKALKKNDEKIFFPKTEPGLSQDFKGEKDVTEFRDLDNDSGEEENSGLHLKFKFPTFEEVSRIQSGTGNIFNSEVVPVTSTSKYEFTSGKSSINTFIDDIETYHVKQMNANFSESEEGLFCDGKLLENFHEKGRVPEKEKEIMVFDGEENGKREIVVHTEEQEFLDESKFEKHSMISDSDSDSDGFLSDGDFVEVNEKPSSDSEFEEHHELSENSDNNDEENRKMQELKNLKEDDNSENSEKTKTENKLESLWEHQELIDQLKMELKKVRATGLPTILEESETPKIMDDLKPWKIDEDDCMGELHKFYNTYRERMRKFDILNYQKMYAMGFLQLNNPLESTPKQKPSPPTLKSLVSQNLWIFKHKIHGTDPMKKLVKELEGDLEVVYVGQMCLSWEFLQWQYEKALDLWDSDPHGIRHFNEVAGEFQQFQVLMQRFIEDEPFQGHRVQNYVKTRCVLRNLAQVPVIREDNMKDKRKSMKKDGDEYVITSDMLVEIVEESIRIFWRFIRADRDCTTTAATNGNKKMPELHNPEDLKLLLEVKKILQKKERKVKDLLRGENCILKKFRRYREEDSDSDSDSDQVLYFFSQVDMKLVCRVLNMSKISRDQLMWCHNKLSRINFVNRKIYVEPAFLLFPC